MSHAINKIPLVYITPPPPPLPQPGPAIGIPAQMTYEFRVVEYVLPDGKIDRVSLQVKINQHDQFGTMHVPGLWQDVPRERIHISTPTPRQQP